MRTTSIALFAAAAAALLTTAEPASAQFSFFNNRYCAQPYGFSRQPDCSYSTWEQCRASARGNGAYCTENPYYQANNKARGKRQRQ